MAKDSIIAEERLFLTANGELVKAGDPRAAELYATPGQEIPRAEAERLGLVEPASAEAPTEPKSQPKSADKSRRAAEDK